jgi:hypothetical protein
VLISSGYLFVTAFTIGIKFANSYSTFERSRIMYLKAMNLVFQICGPDVTNRWFDKSFRSAGRHFSPLLLKNVYGARAFLFFPFIDIHNHFKSL